MDLEERGQEATTLKNITIRGVDARVYDEFSQVMRGVEVTMGEALTRMMGDVLRDFDEVFPTLSAESLRYMMKRDKISISHYGTLRISRKDLVEADRRVNFNHIKELIFEDDVTEEALNTYVGHIDHCDTVVFPSTLPKLLIYSKTQFTKNIETYDVGRQEPQGQPQ
jgi:hypothetical protein